MLDWLAKIPPLQNFVSRLAVNRYARAAPPRPRPLTMIADYASWDSLTDRTFTGRHLPPSDPAFRQGQPAAEEIVKLFRRGDKQINAADTSVLFAFFAQWFTDSFLRTDFFDRRKNTSNHEIDLCQIYGLKRHCTEMLRSKSGGKLKSQQINGEDYPAYLFKDDGSGNLVVHEDFRNTVNGQNLDLHDPRVLDIVFADVSNERKKHAFAVGLEHGNATIGNTLMNIVFLREHNRICGALAALDTSWNRDDERLFQTARNITTVLLLKVVIEDYIRHIAPVDAPIKLLPGLADKERWGRTNWIAIEFNILYRWHSLVPDTISLAGKAYDHTGFRNHNELVTQLGVSALCTDLSRQYAGKIGLRNTPHFLCDPSEPGKPSVKMRTVELSRMANLRSFNDYRIHFSLKPARSFEDVTRDPGMREELRRLYHDDIEKLEWYVGLFAEDYGEKHMMGELLQTMVAYDAFTQALTNPLLSARVYNEKTFTATGMQIIEETKSLEDIVRRNVADPETDASFKVKSRPGS